MIALALIKLTGPIGLNAVNASLGRIDNAESTILSNGINGNKTFAGYRLMITSATQPSTH